MLNQSKMTFLNEGGFPLGLFDWATFENRQRTIAKDFQLLMVSDGWLELISEDSAPAKESFLLNYVQNNQISIPALMRPVKKYPENKMPDDITIFTVNKE
jgi:serine phosphatase RsbU (regulator of sigma subunit)